MSVKVLAGIASAENAPPAARVSAAIALLDRGWGEPIQPHGGDGDDVRITIRQVIDGGDDVSAISGPTYTIGKLDS
jgi:hypothetical protein